MNSIPFQKFHGFGNDYIVILDYDIPSETDIPALAREICHRTHGAGSDGIAILRNLDGKDADYECRIINPDGSEAGFSGNGTRCAVAFLYREKLFEKPMLRLETKSGLKTYEFLKREGEEFQYLAELGKPHFDHAGIPFEPDKSTQDDEIRFYSELISFENTSLPFLALNVGNPVCVLFVENFDFDWRELGTGLETHLCFPERANVVFAKTRDRSNIDIRIWERAAGETSSSGTCSIAAAVAAAKTGRTERNVAVHAVGGTTHAQWRDDNEMLITGSAAYIYTGAWPV